MQADLSKLNSAIDTLICLHFDYKMIPYKEYTIDHSQNMAPQMAPSEG